MDALCHILAQCQLQTGTNNVVCLLAANMLLLSRATWLPTLL